MWKSFSSGLESGNYDVDLNIGDINDSRRGLSILGYIDENNDEVGDNISSFIERVMSIEPEQYGYPVTELHLTVLSIITCFSGFSLLDINPQDYNEIFHDVFNGLPPIEVNFKGITASSSCIIIQGFTSCHSLEALRERLRVRFSESNLMTSIDSRYKAETAHCTAIRFCLQLRDHYKLLRLCERYREHDFGIVTFRNFELVFNNWYQNKSITKSLDKVVLNNSASWTGP